MNFSNNTKNNMLERIDAPDVLPVTSVLHAKTWREAVIGGWKNRKNKFLTPAMLASMTGIPASHICEYLAEEPFDRKGRERRDMPAKRLQLFEQAVGNSFASQWVAVQAQLTILEAQIAEQKAALLCKK